MRQKLGGVGVPLFGGSWVPIEHKVAWNEAYLHTNWHLDASSRLDLQPVTSLRQQRWLFIRSHRAEMETGRVDRRRLPVESTLGDWCVTGRPHKMLKE